MKNADAGESDYAQASHVDIQVYLKLTFYELRIVI